MDKSQDKGSKRIVLIFCVLRRQSLLYEIGWKIMVVYCKTRDENFNISSKIKY